MILFYDTETTGFPDYRAPFGHENQPGLVQLCCILTEDDGHDRSLVNLIVNPGRPIPKAASDIHGITDEIATACGVPESVAVAVWSNLARRASLIVAHNIKFDDTIMACAWARSGPKASSFDGEHSMRSRYCTMEKSTDLVNLPPTEKMIKAGYNKPKPPRLDEAHKHFFSRDISGAHDALVDASACSRIFFHLQKLGVK